MAFGIRAYFVRLFWVLAVCFSALVPTYLIRFLVETHWLLGYIGAFVVIVAYVTGLADVITWWASR